MVVGLLIVELFLPENGSLKEKRYYLRSIKDKLKASFNVSVAETDHQELWQRAQIGIACVGAERSVVEENLSKVKKFLDKHYPEFIVDMRVEYVRF